MSNCDHDPKFGGVFLMPKEDHGCVACGYERATTALEQANARERKAFEQGIAIFANDAGVSFGITAKTDLEQLWQQYRCQDDVDWKVTTPEEGAAIDAAVLGSAGDCGKSNTGVPVEAKSLQATGDTPSKGAQPDEAPGAQTVGNSDGCGYKYGTCYDCATPEQRVTTFIVCPKCGNKRCPRATNCKMCCTGSNEPGQGGSRFQTVPDSGQDDG